MTNRHEGPSSGEDLAVSQSQPVLASNGQPEAVPSAAGDAPTEAALDRLRWYAENPASEALHPGLAADVRDVLKMLSGARAHLAVALNAAKAALPICYSLRDKQYNVETWGLHGRIAALEAALEYGPPPPADHDASVLSPVEGSEGNLPPDEPK